MKHWTLSKKNETIIEETIEQAKLAERIIQYSNRYRNRSEETSKGLSEAEQFFREYEYEEAVECAIRAVEAYDDKVIERATENNIA